MGIFNFRKKKENDNNNPPPKPPVEAPQREEEETDSNLLLNYILFPSAGQMPVDTQKLIKHLDQHWSITTKEDKDDEDGEVIAITLDDFTFFLSYTPDTIPGDELQETANFTYFWENVSEDVQKVQGHLLVVMPHTEHSTLERMTYMSMLVSSILSTTDALGVYDARQTLLLQRDFYIQLSESIKERMIPIILWVYVGIRQEENGDHSMFVFGLDLFNKLNMEVIGFKKDINETHDFLLNIASYVVGADVAFKDGETLGATEEEKIAISISKGVYLEGDTIKIHLD